MAETKRHGLVVPGALASVALVVFVFFSLKMPLPMVDEWIRRWQVDHFLRTHRVLVYGHSFAFDQLAIAAVMATLKVPADAWRLTALPFLAATAAVSFSLARRAGADRRWASVAAMIVPAGPVTLSLATAYMTETFFLGLLMVAAWFAVNWLVSRTGIAWCVLFTCFATLQKQQGVVMPLVIVTALSLSHWRRGRRLNRADVIGATAMCVLVGLVVVLGYAELAPTDPTAPRSTLAVVAGASADATHGVRLPVYAVTVAAFLPGILCLFLVPFLGVGAALVARGRRRPSWRPVLLGFAATMLPIVIWLRGGSIFPGNTLTPFGLGDLFLVRGSKPLLLPLPVFTAVEILALASLAILAPGMLARVRLRTMSTPALLLGLLAAGQLVLVMANGDPRDRFYLPVIAPLIPVVAVYASRVGGGGTAAYAWALGAVAAGILLYASGEQDRQAWEQARHDAALAAYAAHAPGTVDAGWEEIGVHFTIPLIDFPGTVAYYPDAGCYFRCGAKAPVELDFAAANDPRPGYPYTSIAPGKIVIVLNR